MTTNKKISFDLQMFSNYTISGISNGGESSNKAALSVDSGGFDVGSTSGTQANPYSISSAAGADTAATVTAANATWVKLGTDSFKLKLPESAGSDVGVTGTTTTTSIALQGGNALTWSKLNGTATVSLVKDKAFKQTINSQLIDINKAGTADTKLELVGDGSKFSKTEVNSGTVVFNTVKQNWIVNGSNKAVVGLADKGAFKVTGTNATLNSGGTSSYLDVSLGTGTVLDFESSTGIADSVSVKADNMVINGLAQIGDDGKLEKKADSYELTIGSGGNVSLNASRVNAGANATATITGTGTSAYISGIDKLAASGDWALGKDATSAKLGEEQWTFSAANATLTADSNGTSATSVALASGTATLSNTESGITQDLNVNGKLEWNFDANGSDKATLAAFDNSGNITDFAVSGENGAIVEFKATQASNATVASFAAKSGDSLKFAAGGNATVNGSNNIISVSKDGLAANSDWKVTGKSATYGASVGDNTYQSWTLTKKGAVLSTDSLGAITSVSGLTGNATVEHGLTEGNFAINVMSKNWTLAGDTSHTAAFDSVGNASIAASSAVISGDKDAMVTVASGYENGITINGAVASISGDTDGVVFGLEDSGEGTGIASITGLDAGAVVSVSGDNEFVVGAGKSVYTVATV